MRIVKGDDRRGFWLTVTAGVGLLGAVAAHAAAPGVDCDGEAGDPARGSDAWTERDRQNVICANERLEDEYANPAFFTKFWLYETPLTYLDNQEEQLQEPTRPRVTLAQHIPGGRTTDPYRVPEDWQEASRGRFQKVTFIATDGAKLVGRLFTPNGTGPFPGIVITTGSIQGYQELYNWAAEGLAEAGYMVLAYDVQGQGRSETFPHNPDGSYACDSAGCPGVPFQQNYNFFQGTRDALSFLLSRDLSGDRYGDVVSAADPGNPNAAGTDRFNPQWEQLDRSRIGVAGHSLGASAVSTVGQEDSRVGAIVAWDSLATTTAAIHAPALGISSEYFFNAQPMDASAPENPDDCSTGNGGGPSGCKADGYNQVASAGKDAMLVFLRSSTHLEYSYVPYILPASRYGERVAMFYTLAWFDRYLRDDITRDGHTATERLTATVFDGSSDSSSIGAGTYDPATNSSVPYEIEGDSARNRLSFYYTSRYSIAGAGTCGDMRAGCP